MNEPPVDHDDADLLRLVRAVWEPSVDALDHLPVGFGAHHWQARTRDRPRFFVTLDHLGERHTLETLRAAYVGASALARIGLEFVVAAIEPVVVPYADGAVSLTPWLGADAVTAIDRERTVTMLARLHTVAPADLGVALTRWRPVVAPAWPAQIEASLGPPWTGGPYGERSRAAIAAAIGRIEGWTARYLELGDLARSRPWVPTHGEPGAHNQLMTATGTVLVDWESLMLAPPERDLRAVERGDPEMLELFDLEWRLSEIAAYATWFAGEHADTADDRTAFEDLVHELSR